MRPTLADHGYSMYSQYGEDGILDKIFECIGTTSRLCVEFGASDGLHLSNTARLWKDQGWKGLLIEADPTLFAQLRRNVVGYDCVCVRRFVGSGPDDSIEAILAQQALVGEPDLLSIDIDGDDYYIFESLRRLRPRVVVCEYNPTIPAHVDLYADRGSFFGCSVAALVRLGRERRLSLVALTDTNAIFVVDEALPKLSAFDTSVERIRIDRHLLYLITSYGGDYVVHGKPLFRLNFPYRRRLHGDHIRTRFRPPVLRAYRWIHHAIKTQIRRLIHQPTGPIRS